MSTRILTASFFNQPTTDLAKSLLGKILRHRYTGSDRQTLWLAAMIIETEAYEISDRGSHSSLGFTPKRKAMFMDPGTIYMYYARGQDSLNFSAQGYGNAVLIKSGFPFFDELSPEAGLAIMQSLHQPLPGSSRDAQHHPIDNQPRNPEQLCNGQTLLCTALNLKVSEWDKKTTDSKKFRLDDVGYVPDQIIQCPRLGIPPGRDHELKRRFVDFDYANRCTSNPLRKRSWKQGKDYFLLKP